MAAKSSKPTAKKAKATPGSKKSEKATAALPTKAGKRAQASAAVATPPAKKPAARPTFVPRAVANIDDDDVLMAHGGGGAGFGRCGGRLLSNKLEQDLCNRLGMAGIVHSHSPRHYEVKFEDGKVAAYAPMVVLRGRGREGKGVVIEAVEEADAPILRKIVSFRAQYGAEFYVILVGTDEVLDDAPLAAYDESCSAINVNTLIARLAE
ncbi:MAG: hypothetical protein JNK15_21435 [Planctomycetes bacterium]|nr:hypothetical protein [Planctomycetota bacterium]